MKSISILETINEMFSKTEIDTAKTLAEISTQLASKRIDLKMSQTEFAKYLNISQAMVSKIERGDYNFTISNLIKIANKIGLEADIRLNDPKKAVEEAGKKIIEFNQKWEFPTTGGNSVVWSA